MTIGPSERKLSLIPTNSEKTSTGISSIERKCDDWLTKYVEYTEDFEPPAAYQRWMGVLTLAVAAGHRVWLQEANIKVWPNLYVVLVGPSGIGKGQAMREALPF